MPAKRKKYKYPAEKVIVKSKAYGTHERAARGTKSKAVVNKKMEFHGERLRQSTRPAKLIQDALKPFRENFTGGTLWQKLVKHFAAQAKRNEEYSVKGIGDWDFNNEYRTGRIMAPIVKIEPDDLFSMLQVSVNYTFSQRFLERKSNITAFRITIIFLFPDFKKHTIKTIPFILPDKLLTDFTLYSFIVQVPRHAKSFLACFKAEALVNDVLYDNSGHSGKALNFVDPRPPEAFNMSAFQ